MNKRVIILSIFLLSISFVLTGCTKYVCYDGTIQKKPADCPLVEVASVTALDAGRYADNYGNAVAQAKRQAYTRVNMYDKDAHWYANVLFTDSTTGNINKILLKIDGQTGDVTCVTGCEYFAPPAPAPVENQPEQNPEVLSETSAENTTV